MFTVNLKDIEVSPKIEEDKSFDNENRYHLQNEVADYVMEKHAGMYKNPVTLKRKIEEATRDGGGKTNADILNEERDKVQKMKDENWNKLEAAQKKVDEEFGPKMDELDDWRNAEVNKIRDEYRQRIADSFDNDEEEKKLKEEQQLKIDDIEYEYDKRQDALTKEKMAMREQLENE